MKKILTLLGSFGLIGTASTSVIACNNVNSIENTVKNLQKVLNKVAVETEEEAINAIEEAAKKVENVIMDESILPTKNFEILFFSAVKEESESASFSFNENIISKAEHSHEHIHYIITYKKAQSINENSSFNWSAQSFTFEVELHVG
ncbi:lipoprotein [Spiroplasma endosymbiont of Cantharis nigra]|uniref:lipoprotein n=1 Tax=Spiroplasma endosymbiont of Cantharis nigra TaxID=3066278 RepID=UPI0030CD1D5B